MPTNKSADEIELAHQINKRITPLLKEARWILRITEHADKPAPVLVVKERCLPEAQQGSGAASVRAVLKERGLLYGQALRRCLPVLREILSRVNDKAGIPLELHRFIGDGRLSFRGNLPLDEEAGAKLALIFKLQERVSDMDRVELIAWRVERFSREEAVYWLTRATQYGEAANRWAQAGMRLMLGGQPGDAAVREMLEKLRR